MYAIRSYYDQLLGRLGDGGEDVLDIQEVTLPLFGQQQGAIAAPEQLDAEKLLQRLDLVADGRLGDKQFLRRPGKAQMAGGRFERLEGIEGR